MGRPRRTTTPKYGVIAGQRVHKFDSPAHKLETARSYLASCNTIDHPRPSETEHATHSTKRAKVSFEIRTSASTLPVELAHFYASVMPQALDERVSDENEPPSHLSKENAQDLRIIGEVVVIPEPKQRRKREPFAVLHLAKYSSDAQPKPIIVKPEKENSEKRRCCDTGSTCTSDGEGASRPKGLIRLRAKAPPPIDMSLVKKDLQLEKESFILTTIYDSADSLDWVADSKADLVRMEGGSTDERGIPNAPTMSSIPLPPVTPIELRSRATTIPVESELMIPTTRHQEMPITPNRQALLDILNGHSSFERTVGGREKI